jgi:uncharacterized protein
MRTSSYTIYVDLPEPNGDEVLLVHGYSGAYDAVPKDVAAYVRSLEARRPPKPLYGEWSPEPQIQSGEIVPPSQETIVLLKKRGYLTDLSLDEEEDYFCKVAEMLHHRESTGSPAYIFMVTYNCNLRCGYCFQDHMRTNPAFSHLLRRMDRQIVDRILSAFPQIEASHGIESDEDICRYITFFGGEPLLASNREIVEYIMTQVLARGPARFTAVTNGTDLKDYEDLLGPQLLSALQITLDGPSPEHDRRRIYADGSGSSARITENITMALERGVRVEVRTNVDRTNIGFLPNLAEEIIANGWDRYSNFVAYTAPVAPANDKTDRKTTMSSWELDKRLNDMRDQDPRLRVIARPDDGLLSKIGKIFGLQEDPFENFRSTYCGAHGRMYVFDPFGDIYACWEKTGDRRIRIGHVEPDGRVASEVLQATWRSRTVASNPVCRRCRFALSCGGGCATRALQSNGSLFTNYCDGFGARFRAVAAEAYMAHRSGNGIGAAKREQAAPC